MSRLIRTDWHIHTYLSDCGAPEATPEAIVTAAHEAGLEAIGITDHVILPKDRSRPALVRELLTRDADGLRVYVGCEADMQSPTRASIDRGFAAGLDYVIMATSHLFDPGMEPPPRPDPRAFARLILELTQGAIASRLGDIIAHPFGVPACPFEWAELVAAADRDEVSRTAEEAARAGVAMELNPRYLRQAPEAARWLFQRVLEAGCKLALSSDAHHPLNVGCRGPQYADEEEIRALGITEEHLWTLAGRRAAKG